MDPREVLSGMGTQRYGGRFATVGTRAVYLAGSDETAQSRGISSEEAPRRYLPDHTRQVPQSCLRRQRHLTESSDLVAKASVEGIDESPRIVSLSR